MRRLLPAAALALVACGGAAQLPASPSAATATPAQVSPSASVAPVTRVEGTVAAVGGMTITLADYTVLDLTPTTRIVRTDKATIADLSPGTFVAITAKQQQDGTLLASIVNVFPPSVAGSIPAGQRPLPQGELMTNAPVAAVDQVSGSSFTVTFPGGSAKVLLAPGAVITKQTDVKPQDVPIGAKLTAMIRGGVVQSIQLITP